MEQSRTNDPFSVIECEVPALDEVLVRDAIRHHYGLEGEFTPLVSERDQNFRLRCADSGEYVVKIANAAEDPQATDFQIQALLYLESWQAGHDSPIRVPRIVPAADGASHVLIDALGAEHVARVVSYIPGVPLLAADISPRLCRRAGAYLAHLGRALRGFEHPGARHGLLWDMQQAPELRRILRHIAESELRDTVRTALDDFEAHALPHFPELRSQVIHSDFNPGNLLIDADEPDTVAGVIDFGDMLHAPLVVDVAIGASYLRTSGGHPLGLIAEFVAGYHAITPLKTEEIDLLPDLVRTRLAASVAILAWRASLRSADDAYLADAVASESSAAPFLCVLGSLPRDHARQTLRQVCAGSG